MKIPLLVAVVIICFSSVQAGSYQVVYQERIVGAEGYAHIGPVIDADQSLVAFVYSDPVDHDFVIDFANSDSSVVIHTARRSLMTLNYWTPDSLLVFALSRHATLSDSVRPELRRVKLDASGVTETVLDPPMPWWGGMLENVILQSISFGTNQEGETTLVLGQEYLFENYELTQGWEHQRVSGTSSFDFGLNVQSPLTLYSAIRYANLTADEGREWVWYNDYYYSYDFRDYPDDPNWGTYQYLFLGVKTNSGDSIIRVNTEHGSCLRLFADDFISGNLLDEMIFYGYSADLTGQHLSASHAACYSFASGQAEGIWYTPLSGVTLDYDYKPQHYIAGMRGQNKMIALNYWNGVLSDSVSLDRNLTATTFFEIGNNPPLLNLVGRSFDTIFVYQFETPTGVDDNEETVLPSSLSLTQNYPNPFNGETVIRFSNNTRQHLTLTIYNVLGQEVLVLHDAETPPGDLSFSWGGFDHNQRPVASGVYFARLVSPTATDMIKMVLLK